MNSGTSGTDKTNEFQDPDGTYYGMQIVDFAAGTSGASTQGDDGDEVTNGGKFVDGEFIYSGSEMDHVVYLVTGARCDGEKVIGDTKRHFAILYRLEGAGTYCIDDQ